MSRTRSAKRADAKFRVFLIDDHPMTRRGLSEMINHERDLTVCGEAEDAIRGLEAVGASQPDLVLVDLTLPRKSGLTLIKEIRVQHPSVFILALSMHDETIYAERVLRSGAQGYIMKNVGGAKLLKAIRQVLNGGIYVSDRVSSKILNVFAGQREHLNDSPVGRLTDREFEVFQLLGQGLRASEIGERLHLSSKTIDTHRLHIKEKLQLKSLPELMKYAVRWAATEEMI